MDDNEQRGDQPMTIKTGLAKRIQEELGENVYLCYQCVKCTSGCPVGDFFDWQPNQIMRAVQLGQEDIAFRAETPWLCASCQTCTTRCPQGLDIAAIMDFLTREAKAQGYEAARPELNIFNEAFMREVKLWGRSYEPGLMVEMTLRNRDFKTLREDLDMYIQMLQKGKVSFFPTPTRLPSKRKIKPIAGAADSIGYYPGCSLEGTASEYNESTRAITAALGLRLIELDGWVCCGSSPGHKIDPELALRLPLENLVLAEKNGFSEVTMPCASCYNRHKAALYEIRHHEEAKEQMAEAMGYQFQDSIRVTSLAESIFQHVEATTLAEKVQNPLKGLKVVCYYGCLLTRPPEVTEAQHPENPTQLDDLMTAMGAEVIDWSYKTSCCGAAHSAVRPDIVIHLSQGLIEAARLAGADAIAVACPLCHLNLDARQMQMDVADPMPVLYFTQLMALALGLPIKVAMLGKNLVDPRPVLEPYLP